MRNSTIARAYAEALFDLAVRHGEEEAFAEAFGELSAVLESDPRIRLFLETPKVDTGVKMDTVRDAFGGRVPRRFLNFMLLVLRNHREALFGEIERSYRALLDERAGIAHVDVTLAREPSEEFGRELADTLSDMLAVDVVPHVHVNPAIVGGIVVRHGDRVVDGSLRRRMVSLRRELMNVSLPRWTGPQSETES